MKLKTNRLRDAVTFALAAGATTLAGHGVAFAQTQSQQAQTGSSATTLDRIEVTGSRIRRAAIEGALPVTVVSRTEIDAAGDITVADFLRNTNFNSFGSYQSTSGSSWGGFSGISLRGLGAERTLILIDGRRAPKAPMVGSAQDLNSIPMAAIERIEVLSDGASAIYGSDAIAGVVNIIMRKDLDGLEFTYGAGRPTEAGGDTEEISVVVGTSSDRGHVLAGASYNKRDVVYTRDRDYWFGPDSPGASSYSNNFSTLVPDADGNLTRPSALGTAGRLRHPLYGAAVPGLCTNGDDSDLFYLSGSTSADLTCQFNHSATSANLTSLENTAIFGKGEFQISDDWSVYFSARVNRNESFGRFAPVPSSPWPGGAILLEAGTPNHPGTIGGNNPLASDPYYQQFATRDLLLYHRFAALGARDGRVENTTYDYLGGFRGRLGEVDLEFGARYVESRATSLGTNYVVGGLAQQAITAGRYNIYDPYSGNPGALGITSTISRDMKTTSEEVYASAGFDLFELPGGTVGAVFGAEYRDEYYQDNYDPLSESGQIVGSAGNSAAGGRSVYAAYTEFLFPIFDGFEVNVAGRYEDYSDYGSDFAPKVSLRWQPIDSLTLRASYGEGFRAPPLNLLTQKTAFSATATTDPATCTLLTGTPSCQTQVTTYSISNPALGSEQSEQWGLGAVWDAASWLNLSLDYYNIEITESIQSVSLATIVGCLRGTIDVCPTGISQFPGGTSVPNEQLGLGAQFDPVTGGIVNAQTGSANIGWIQTQGYDFSTRTNFNLGDFGSLRNQLTLTYVGEYSSNGNPNIAGRPGSPRMRGVLNNTWSFGDWTLNYNINYIHGTQSTAYREWLALARNPNRSPTQDRNMALYESYPDRLPSYLTQDIQLNYRAPWNATITLGVNNIANKDPVYDTSQGGASYDSYLYDPWGRVPYFRYTQRF
ncbi:TonB-dependent receptor [Luteimonas sp. RC10]|uniref:TonB-dependent receptor plug domain-containing protein n=1 Tax=Luteimonas sp. RC10 TaxID=2587035 RepID=UPI00161CD225|nr:TonB-dependent receptor [Luteimonas sp. RC10]MBB3345013.1 iron complex outermembrane receptor protein [Luteimonas sp. RC10]